MILFPELFDVTTIIRYKTLPQLEQGKNNASLVDRSQVTITVHARNNALGLPIFLEDGSVVSANVGVDVEECSPYIGRCDWQAENMILGNNSSAPFTSTGN
ncbi:hypothetical protein C0J52_02061 [Blattella germanica]|nr:hypothetical protein C0J52_02061 [Blattella germanica]